jgi:hypothetical protein
VKPSSIRWGRRWLEAAARRPIGAAPDSRHCFDQWGQHLGTSFGRHHGKVGIGTGRAQGGGSGGEQVRGGGQGRRKDRAEARDEISWTAGGRVRADVARHGTMTSMPPRYTGPKHV